jgi:hypothetical protein
MWKFVFGIVVVYDDLVLGLGLGLVVDLGDVS